MVLPKTMFYLSVFFRTSLSNFWKNRKKKYGHALNSLKYFIPQNINKNKWGKTRVGGVAEGSYLFCGPTLLFC